MLWLWHSTPMSSLSMDCPKSLSMMKKGKDVQTQKVGKLAISWSIYCSYPRIGLSPQGGIHDTIDYILCDRKMLELPKQNQIFALKKFRGQWGRLPFHSLK